MARGKYSPYCKSNFVSAGWKTGSAGTVEVDADGFDYYGYDENGRDKAGKTEDDYLLMSDDQFDDVVLAARAGLIYRDVHDQLTRLEAAMEEIDLKAEAGLCQMGHAGTREFLKDIRKIVAELNQ